MERRRFLKSLFTGLVGAPLLKHVALPATVKENFPIGENITVLPADDPNKLRISWVCYEEIGIVVANTCALSRVKIGS